MKTFERDVCADVGFILVVVVVMMMIILGL